MEELRRRTPNTNLSFYIDVSIIEHVYKAVGVSLRGVTGTGGMKNGIVNGNNDSDGEDGEILDEEVPDEADDEFIWWKSRFYSLSFLFDVAASLKRAI